MIIKEWHTDDTDNTDFHGFEYVLSVLIRDIRVIRVPFFVSLREFYAVISTRLPSGSSTQLS